MIAHDCASFHFILIGVITESTEAQKAYRGKRAALTGLGIVCVVSQKRQPNFRRGAGLGTYRFFSTVTAL